MEVALIVNSHAGRGRAAREAEEFARVLRDGGLRVVPMLTERAGGGVPLARAAASSYDMVVAVGGDGTVNEVVNGLYEGKGRARFAVAPFGSGNDFAKVLGMPAAPAAAARSIMEGADHLMDIGRVRASGEGGTREALFANAVGIGFDGLVAERARSSRKVRGVAGYLYVALKTLIEWDYPELEIVVNDEVIVREPGLLATAGNGTCSGGGFYLTPLADPADGLLDLCVVTRPSVMGIVRLLPALLRGRHLEHRAVSYRQVPGLRVRSPEGLCVHVDGEIVSNNATDISIQVIPAALTVVAPRLG